MFFGESFKNWLLTGLAASNRLAHQFRLPKAVRGGPIRADGHFRAGGVKVGTLHGSRIFSLPTPLIYYKGDPNISLETQRDLKEVRFGEVALWEYSEAKVLQGALGGLHGVSKYDYVIPGLNHSCLDENLFFETRFRVPSCSEYIDFGFLLDGGPGANYYHWIIDILPALGLAKKALGTGVKFILNPYSTMREAQWDELGIPRDSRIVSKGPLRVGKLYTIGGLHNSVYGVFRPEPCLEFWREFAKPARFNRRLFVSRQDSKKRNLLNEDELFCYLKKIGFEMVVLNGLSLAKQAALFAEASDVVGMHGAGLANLIHCFDGIRLIEIFPPEYSHGFYQYLCNLKEGFYKPVYSRNVSGGKSDSEFNSKSGILGYDQIQEILFFFGNHFD